MIPAVRLAVDLQALQIDGFADRGIGRYIAGHTAALARAGRLAAALLAPELPPPTGLPPEVATGLARWDSIGELRALLADGGPIAHHVPAPFLHTGPTDPSVLVIVPHWAAAGVARVVTLHDLIPLRDPARYLPTPAHVDRYRTRASWVATSDLVLTNSEYTRREAIELLGCDPTTVVTVGAGVSPFFTPADGTDNELFVFWLDTLGDRPFVLTVGGSDARKGTENLVAALGLVVHGGLDVHLVVVGHLTAPWRSRLSDAARRAGIEDRLIMTGPVGDDVLRACYRRARLTVTPSLAEGFGFPVLESAACGTPSLASASTALVEAAATTLATFDPADTDAMASTIAAVLSDDERSATILAAQRDLAARSTWDAVASRTATALDDLAPSLPPTARRAPSLRRRIALVGPLPPLGGGIGLYNERLVHASPSTVALDTVTPLVAAPELPPGVGHVSASAFGIEARPASYDAVVYTVGNSDGHLPTIELALRYPGWLWLHEVRLPAVAVTALAGSEDEEFARHMAWLLERSYPGRAPLGPARRAGRSVLDLINAGVGFLPLLTERCQGLLVNSEVARQLALLDLAPLARHPPIHVLPPGCPPVPPGRRTGAARVDGQEGDPVVVAFGVVSMAKRPDLLVDAAAEAGCRITFVGPCPPILVQVIGDRARYRGITDRVTVTGAVDGGDWRGWLDRATLAVQLRESSSGETSAAVLECLAAGVPVLTNLATAAEYGEGTVALVGSADAGVVAERLRALLDNPGDRATLSEAGMAFARSHRFDRLADTLVALVTGSGPPS
ncbi:MAG TPA: glycosyltransferase [Acidimicrobiales bacterium]|nr:glycosyltransferase [Acidimicrobiales bacterium]